MENLKEENVRKLLSAFGGNVGVEVGLENSVNGLVSSCSSIGSKLGELYQRKMYNTIAKDLIASNLNELAALGCRAVGFSHYVAVDNLEKSGVLEINNELKSELQKYNCPIIASQTREDDTVINTNNVDSCGFVIGINPMKKEPIVSGDIVIGFVSSGIHSTGFSMIRKLYIEAKLTEEEYLQCLEPSFNYYNEVLDLYKKDKIKAAVNIKGGIYKCLNKILPKGLKADLNLKHIPSQPIFVKLRELCGDEFYNIFNAGIGFCLITERASNEIFFEDCKKFDPLVLGVIE